jgi:inhibitor of cysteine peptidase
MNLFPILGNVSAVAFSAAILVAVLAITATACTESDVNLDESFDGFTVEAKRGDFVTIALPSNPTTGFSWHLGAIDEPILELRDGPDFTPRSDLVGAPGVELFRFRAMAGGETTIEMEYRRPWERGPSDKTYSVTIVVDGSTTR